MDRKSILNKCKSYIEHENLSKLNYIFEYDSMGIAKQFIKEAMGLDYEIMSFDDIRKGVCYIVSHMKIEFPNQEVDFYNTIFKRLLHLESLPKTEYEILRNKVKDLSQKIHRMKMEIVDKENKIKDEEKNNEDKIEELNNKIKKLQNKCKSYQEELKQKEMIAIEVFPKLDYERRRCNHYKLLLEDELKKIQSINLKIRALSNSSVTTFDNDIYKYHISSLEDNEELFLPDCDYSISVKFAKELNEFIEKVNNKINFDDKKYKEECSNYLYHSNIIESLRNKSIEEYKAFLENYIQEKNVCEYIIENVKNNHVLNKRWKILKSALECYKSGQYLAFVNIVIIQIEGMFYDYCFELNIRPKQLNSFSLSTKLNNLYDKKVFNAYEYFAFDFPLIRNKVAHGLMIEETDKTEIEKIAHETLLDLQYLVYTFQTNYKFPYYKPLEFAKSYINVDSKYAFNRNTNKTKFKDEYLYSHLKNNKYNLMPYDPINNLQWILNPMYDEVYKFYEISGEHKEIKNRLLSCSFIEFISEKINNLIASTRHFSNDNEVINELKVWVQLFQVIICYCNDNNISKEISNKIKNLKDFVENNIEDINK